LQVLELPAELEIVAGRELDFLFDAGFRLAHIAFNIAPAQIDKNGGTSLAGFTSDRRDLFKHLESRDLTERHEAPLFRAHGQALHHVNTLARILRKPHDNWNPSIAFDKVADFMTGQGSG